MEGAARPDEPDALGQIASGRRADTIFALSSGALPAAIAVVRVSGPIAGEAVRRLAGRLPAPRRATVRTLRDAADAPLDRALVLWFPGPATATGEDLAELHLHGGRAVVAAVTAALAAMPGCRPAKAGEFTRRAFEHGRLDLLQAEGLAELLAAETEGARRRALRLTEGGLSRRIEQWRQALLVIAARVEAVLEFGGDDPDIAPDPGLPADLAALADDMTALLAQPPAERLRDGVRVLVAGPPNAGKSTLINRLAGREVAIATDVPGTTRDLLEAPVIFGGLALILIDSAGLRDSDDPVEQIGVRRAHEALASADLVLWLGAPEAAPAAAQLLRVQAKSDLGERMTGADIAVSAKTGEGMAGLRQAIVAICSGLLPSELSLTRDQRSRVEKAADMLWAAFEERDEVVTAEHIRAALVTLDQLTGRFEVEPFLDQLFGSFCIGK